MCQTLNKATTLLSALFFASGAFAGNGGVTDTTVTFTQVAALEGPASALGMGMNLGIRAAFEEANAAGGVHGRTLQLLSLNDSYEPDQSIRHFESTIAEDNSIGFIGPVGTPTSKATQPIATKAKHPFIGPFTGAGFLRDSDLTNVLNVRATYAAETEEWVRHLVEDRNLKSIAILYQDDGFGRVGLSGVTAALDKRGMSLVAEGKYTRNTTAVKSALLSIRKAKPDAIVMVGAYKPIAEFIRLSKKMKMDPVFVNISFVGSAALASDLGEDGQDVIISQVVPFPWNGEMPLVAAYQKALKEADADASPDFVSLEGYIVGRLAIKTLEATGKELDRDSFLAAMNALTDVDLDGLILSYGAGDNQGLDQVFLSRITEGETFESIASTGSNS